MTNAEFNEMLTAPKFYRFTVTNTTGRVTCNKLTCNFEQIRNLWNDFTNMLLDSIETMTVTEYPSAIRTDEDLEKGVVIHHWSRKGFTI